MDKVNKHSESIKAALAKTVTAGQFGRGGGGGGAPRFADNGRTQGNVNMANLTREIKTLSNDELNSSQGRSQQVLFSFDKFVPEFHSFEPSDLDDADGSVAVIILLKNVLGTCVEGRGPQQRKYYAFNGENVKIKMVWNGRYLEDADLV